MSLVVLVTPSFGEEDILYAPKAIQRIFTTVRGKEPGVRDGGIVGDAKHGSGYHLSWAAISAKGRIGIDYSTIDKRDKAYADREAASAFDLTMSDVLMRKITARLKVAIDNKDPRIVGYLREVGGTLNSKAVWARRVEDNKALSFDPSHLWHIHGSIFRKYSLNDKICQGIADVIAGIPLEPFKWDGKTFPGADQFYVGVDGAWITFLGQRLVVHGWTGYTVGPGPTFTSVDQAAVKWFQEKQGWTGSDADGIPGPKTWELLLADPAKPEEPTEPSHPVLYPTPKTNLVYMEKLVPGQTNSDSVWQLQDALRKLGFDCQLTGSYDAKTVVAVKHKQSAWRDDVVDGVVGPLQTAAIMKEAGKKVEIIPVQNVTPTIETVKGSTWNILKTNSQKNINAGLKSLVDADNDFICVQELSDDAKQAATTKYLAGLGWGATKKNSAVTIFWNKKTQKLVKEDFILVTKGGEPWESGAGGADSIYKIIMVTVLQDLPSGRQHVVLNNHIVPSIEKNGELDTSKPIRLKNYRMQRDVLCKAFKDYGANSKVVTAWGDFNLAWEYEAARDMDKALEKVGATVVWDEFPDVDTHGTRVIDWGVGKNSSFRSVKVGEKSGSDHSPVTATFTI